MKVSLTQSEINEVLATLPPVSPLAERFADLVRESSTLRVIHEVGLADGQPEAIQKRFANWPGDPTVIYASETDARSVYPMAFHEVCTEWGRAGYTSRRYVLRDGRVVVYTGIWWDVPEPGGFCGVFYFE